MLQRLGCLSEESIQSLQRLKNSFLSSLCGRTHIECSTAPCFLHFNVHTNQPREFVKMQILIPWVWESAVLTGSPGC